MSDKIKIKMHFQDNPAIRILLVDDHELIRIGVRTLFQSDPSLQLVGEADNFDDALRLTQSLSPDVILLDMKLKGDFITERIPDLLSACPSGKVLALTASNNREMHLLALQLGAVGIFIKSQPACLILKAIHSVYMGEVWLDNALASSLLQNLKENPFKSRAVEPQIKNLLTGRELEIAQLAVKGLPAKKIAAQLLISEKTVRNQLVIIYNKLGVASQTLGNNTLNIQCRQTGFGRRFYRQ